ncbi:MAG: DUF5668 domain-containing protein [Candidatus Aminicenantes bacterium]|nr:DUF5668 domain-containing protein [Candidatus Aminicenantes bacterium]
MEEKIILKRPPKSGFLAGLLSFIFPGLGSLYNRQVTKGLMFMVIFAGLVTLQTSGEGQPFAALLLAGFWFYQLIDAVMTAKTINRKTLDGDYVEETVDEFPEIVKSGSVFWGIIIMVIGGILLLANFDIINYGTIFDFWPLIIIAIGVKLVMDYMAKNREE